MRYGKKHTSTEINQSYSISSNWIMKTMATELSNRIYRKNWKGIEMALEVIKNLKVDGDTVIADQFLGR